MKNRYVFIVICALMMTALAGCEDEKTAAGSDIQIENNFNAEQNLGSNTSGDENIIISASNDSATETEMEVIDTDASEGSDESEEAAEELQGEEPEIPEEDVESDSNGDEDNSDNEEEKSEDSNESGEENEELITEEEAGQEPAAEPANTVVTPGSTENVAFNEGWTYGSFSAIHSGSAVMYRAADNRKGIVIGVNAGHGTKGGSSVKTYCHPDMTPKVTGGSTAAGSLQATAISGGMSFYDGTAEASVTLRTAQILRDKLLLAGYDVLMLRDGSDVQLDNIARTLICNNNANCHISLHWDGDGLDYDKGCFYISVPDGIKAMEPVASTWTKSEALGKSLISGLESKGCKIYKGGAMAIDLTQTSYSTIPSVDLELGNASSAHDDASLSVIAEGIAAGVKAYFP